MTELLTAAQMRAIEAAAIASGQVTGLELMERAGRGVVQAVFDEWPDLRATSHRAVVLCGPGNNGGDGFVVARVLKEWGWEVEVFLYGEVEGMPPDARVNYERWLGMGEVRGLFSSLDRLWNDGPRAHLVVDAVFGIGLSRPLEEGFREVGLVLFDDTSYSLSDEEGLTQRVVAVDIPSGVCADSGRELGYSFPAHLTVAFHRPKLGNYLTDRPTPSDFALQVVSIGFRDDFSIPDWLQDATTAGDPKVAGLMHQLQFHPALRFSEVVKLTRRVNLSKGSRGHKFSYGHALIQIGRAHV